MAKYKVGVPINGYSVSISAICSFEVLMKTKPLCYFFCKQLILFVEVYVSLQLLVQNRKRKWHFPLNFRNCINWTSPFPLNIRNAIIWAGAFSRAFSSSEVPILVLSKNACLYDNISNSFQSKIYSNGHVWIQIYEFAICASVKKHANRTPTFGNGSGIQKMWQKVVQVSPLALAKETISVLQNF